MCFSVIGEKIRTKNQLEGEWELKLIKRTTSALKQILANNNEVSRWQTRNKRRTGKHLWKLFLKSRQMVGMAYMCLTAATCGVTKTSWSADGFESHRTVCTQRDAIGRKMQKSSEEEECKQKCGHGSRTSFPHCHKSIYASISLTWVL